MYGRSGVVRHFSALSSSRLPEHVRVQTPNISLNMAERIVTLQCDSRLLDGTECMAFLVHHNGHTVPFHPILGYSHNRLMCLQVAVLVAAWLPSRPRCRTPR